MRRLLLSTTHYGALGLTRTASAADVREAFRRIALRVHPDRFHAEPDSAQAAAAPEVPIPIPNPSPIPIPVPIPNPTLSDYP